MCFRIGLKYGKDQWNVLFVSKSMQNKYICICICIQELWSITNKTGAYTTVHTYVISTPASLPYPTYPLSLSTSLPSPHPISPSLFLLPPLFPVSIFPLPSAHCLSSLFPPFTVYIVTRLWHIILACINNNIHIESIQKFILYKYKMKYRTMPK